MARAPVAKADEDGLEADRLAGFPHPRETIAPVGHGAAEAALRAAFDGGRMHHAWLLTGPEGIGKATLAYAFSSYVLATPAERARASSGRVSMPADSPSVRQIRGQAHPGLLVVRRTSDGKRLSSAIRVEEVRRLRSFLGLTAAGGGWRVVIVDPADDMNQSSANAILKSLEEPPARCLFLLVSAEPGRLLPTIRSRCRTLEMAPLSPADLERAAGAAMAAADLPMPPKADAARLGVLAQGSVRRYLMLAGSDGLALYDRLVALVAGLPELDLVALHALADELAPAAAEEKFEAFFGLLLDLVRRLVGAAVSGRAAIETEGRLAQRIGGEAALASWAELWETTVRDKAIAMALNLDKKSLILETAARMRAAALSGG
jgi:DNA polymerase-3 subunit delta'